MRPFARFLPFVFLPFVLTLTIPGTVPAFADDAACKTFKWDLSREQRWFEAAGLPSFASGAAPKMEGSVALRLNLSPIDGLAFAVAPEHKPAAGSFGAVLSLPALDKASLYQVTLSDEGWIDVIQDGASVKSGAFSGAKGCPGLRKSVRFDLKPGPVTLQISGVKAQTINVAVGPAD
ncbi:hypothetical protein GCM10007874_54970 [Labrys miyagiensis]|uniref:Uncharacterized protein n=1 Tax=Labrys miyagiensis TaxID=346912 RepID=A0ABQ6CQP5_9HYPH|nr:hypothetical protein [Labrys miyagiensis]GLS22479.1 hypothetical protein GCM10007874_54970 [Labrys miyagiensis]